MVVVISGKHNTVNTGFLVIIVIMCDYENRMDCYTVIIRLTKSVKL